MSTISTVDILLGMATDLLHERRTPRRHLRRMGDPRLPRPVADLLVGVTDTKHGLGIVRRNQQFAFGVHSHFWQRRGIGVRPTSFYQSGAQQISGDG